LPDINASGTADPAKFRRPRVVRIIQQSIRPASRIRTGESFGFRINRKRFLLGRRFVSHRAGKQPHHRFHNHGCGHFSAAQNVIADGKFAVGEKIRHPFIHALVAPADQHDAVEQANSAATFA
jgi:hypothetical protein